MFYEGAKDRLEQKTLNLTEKLFEHASVPLNLFGVTGSILLGIHSLEYSDIDITVYGGRNSLKIKNALIQLYENKDSGFEKFASQRLKTWCEDKVKLYPLTMADAEKMYTRIWNRGIFNGTLFSIHPTKLDSEIKERYEDKTIQPKGLIEVEATVKDSTQAIFTPSTYKIENIHVRSGIQADVKEILSYEGLYGGIFNDGDQIIVRGLLEKVKDKLDGSYWRVVVGSLTADGKDYVKLKS